MYWVDEFGKFDYEFTPESLSEFRNFLTVSCDPSDSAVF